MRIGIIGIGGVGGYYGGKLAMKYTGTGEHQVIFFARGEHLDGDPEGRAQACHR